MKNNFLIGLGGSGGKIIASLYSRLINEMGPGFSNDVVGIAIDTDQDELNALSQLGVRKICLSGEGTVGDYFNRLGDDVATWCPNTQNEGVFFASDLFNGASQCRFKSRLCLASFLKDTNNELERILEDALLAGNSNGTTSTPPKFLIASSIAGGTGSGIFIQVALYIKQFFKKRGIKPVIHGIFACPDLYADVVPQNDLPNIYANAYAVVRELNAMNLIAGDEITAAYGGEIDINMELSTSCEGKLFEKSIAGRYGEKPYDIMYFIDKYNYLSRIRGGLNDYYKAMADIAFAHFYTEISGAVMTDESNEMDGHSIAPNAIYASSGAAEIKYPYADVLKYMASRSINDSFSAVWTRIDEEWKNKLEAKDATERERGLSAYVPKAGERAEHYMETFAKLTNPASLEATPFSFLYPMAFNGNVSKAESYMESIRAAAEKFVLEDKTLESARSKYGIDDISSAQNDVMGEIDTYFKDGSSDDAESVFDTIAEIDSSLASYCKDGIRIVVERARDFANEIFTDSKNLWKYFDNSDVGLVNGLLYDSVKKEWAHPVAARYMLYALATKMKEEMDTIMGNVGDTPAEDSVDFYNYMVGAVSDKINRALNVEEGDSAGNIDVLVATMKKLFYPKAKTKEAVIEYFSELSKVVKNADDIFVDALVYFACLRVYGKILGLIKEYETFFDNIDDFMRKAATTTTVLEVAHDESNEAHFVCASAAIKRKMYDEVGRNLTSQTGDTASNISHALFSVMRQNLAARNENDATELGVEVFFDKVMDIVAETTGTIPEVSGKINKNVFDAIRYEYELTYPDYASDVENYLKNEQAKNRFDEFLKSKLIVLSNMAAPMLRYDAQDPYSGMFDKKTNVGVMEKPAVNDCYKYISQSTAVEESIKAFCNNSAGKFFDEFAKFLPKDVAGQTINIRTVGSNKLDDYTILCYTTVQCLQPYQIAAFDELKGGDYYTHYADRLVTMETYKKYSLSPHLDKRWHKRGYLPYINVRKENESRLDLAKAFLYALCFGKICYTYVGNDIKFVYGDSRRNERYDVVYHKGASIPFNKVNRMMEWFADHEEIVASYASRFDSLINEEIAGLEKYSDTVGGYKTGVTNYADILNQLKIKAIQHKEVLAARDGKDKKAKEFSVSVLDIAWNLHLSEEKEIDKDYGELLIDVLCEIIKLYAKAPYNNNDIENKVKGSESYIRYTETCEHIATKFLVEYAKYIGDDLKQDVSETVTEETEEETVKPVKADLSDGDNVGTATRSITNNPVVEKDRRFVWAKQAFNRFLTSEI